MTYQVSYGLIRFGVGAWAVYLFVYSFFVALCTCFRADAIINLAEHREYLLPATVMNFFCSIWESMLSICFRHRDSFKDIPMSEVSNPDSMANAVQIVRSLSQEIRVLLLTLGQTVYHNGKFPKSKKTVRFEFGQLSAAFPHVCEGISVDNLIDRQAIHRKQAGQVGALGIFYIVYCLFVLRVMETLVVGSSRSKAAPNRVSCYARVDALFTRRSQAASTKSNFKLSGAGYLEFVNQKTEQNTRSKEEKTRRTRRKTSTTPADTLLDNLYRDIFF